MVERPGLAGDRLDHVVAVERLQALEVVDASRAPGAAHVHVRPPSRAAPRSAGCRFAGPPGRRSRSRTTRRRSGRAPPRGPGRWTLIASWVPVARGQIAVASRQHLVVDRGARRRRAPAEHPQVRRHATADLPHAVAAAGIEPSEDDAAQLTGVLRGDDLPAAQQPARPAARRSPGLVRRCRARPAASAPARGRRHPARPRAVRSWLRKALPVACRTATRPWAAWAGTLPGSRGEGRRAVHARPKSGRPDLNRGPLPPKGSALPGCATPRGAECSRGSGGIHDVTESAKTNDREQRWTSND